MTRKEKRLELHEILCGILGSRNVYFQPPESVKLQYPAIVYQLNNVGTEYADNKPYIQSLSYTVTVIDKDPDSELPVLIGELPKCAYDRHFSSSNLNHYVFVLYY